MHHLGECEVAVEERCQPRRLLLAELQNEGPHHRLVAVPDPGALNELLLDPDTVGGLVVLDDPPLLFLAQGGMPARDGEIVQDDVVVVRPPDRRLLFREVEDLRAAVKRENIELKPGDVIVIE